MKTIVKLLAKVPAQGRFPVLIVLAVLGFFFGMNGVTGDGPVWQAIVGIPLFLLVAYTFYYLITNKTQL